MHTVTPQRRDEDRETLDAQTDQLPRRPRRRFLTPRSAALLALVMCAVGFYAGVRVEKGQVSSASATAGGASAARPGGGAAARSRLAGLFGGAGRGGGRAGSPGAAGATGNARGSGAPGGAGGGASFGTVASVRRHTLYVTEVSGNTVKVKLSKQTKLTKSESVSRTAIHPGDTVVVQGVSGSKGTLSAASITDSGARSGSSRSSGRGSAVSSLFSPGG